MAEKKAKKRPTLLNYNLRFFREKLKLTQEKFAETLEAKRGKLTAYEVSTAPRPEFLELLAKKYNVNLHLFITHKMTDETYEAFFLSDMSGILSQEPPGDYWKEPEDLVAAIQKMKNEDDPLIRSQQADTIITSVVRQSKQMSDMRIKILELEAELRENKKD